MRWVVLLAALALAPVPARAESAPAFGVGPITPSLEVGFPHPVTLSVDVRLDPKISAGLSASPARVATTVSGVSVSSMSQEARLRYHPFGGALFFGLATGIHELTGVRTASIVFESSDVSVVSSVRTTAPYLLPHAGWTWVLPSGVTLGLEGGWLFPLGAHSTFKSSAGDPLADLIFKAAQQTNDFQRLVADVRRAADRIGATSVPFLTLLRIGWTF